MRKRGKQMNDLIKKVFSEIEFSVVMFPESRVIKIRHYDKLKALISKEVEFWDNYRNGHLSTIRNHFRTIHGKFSTIEGNSSNENTIRVYLQQIKSELDKHSFPQVFSVTSYAKFLTKLYEESHDTASRAVEYLFGFNFGSFSNKEGFNGLQKAYEYVNDMKFHYSEAENNNRQDIINQFNEEYSLLINMYQDTKDKIKNETKEFKDEISEWTEVQKNSLEDFINKKKDEMEKLELLYREKLRLESPAEYWNKLSIEYKEKGDSWKNKTLILSVVYIVLLSGIMLMMPQKLFSNDIFDFNNLKITISFAFVTSIGIFLIRLFVKLTLSNYHLSTDSKERYQLTHVYLSLIKESAISENERALVIQSIFSRSETGLIKGDSTPAFPESVVSGIIGNLKR